MPDGFGLGTEIGDGFFGHNGHNVGYNCFSYAWPDAGTAIAVMANSDDCKDLFLALIKAFGDRLTVN